VQLNSYSTVADDGSELLYLLKTVWILYDKCELLLMRRATASVESGATSGTSVHRAITTLF